MSVKKRLSFFFQHPSWYLWVIPGAVAWGAQRMLASHPGWVERFHSRALFRWLSIPISTLTSLLPFSLTEWVVVGGSLFLLVWFLIGLIRWIQKPQKAAKAGRLLKRIAWTASVLYLVFMLLHGFNYARLPIAQSFSFPARERTSGELKETAIWLIRKTNEVRALCSEDEQDVFVLKKGIKGTLKTVHEAYRAASSEYPLLSGPSIRPKGVWLSHYWSYTGIAGMYMPFFVESNVNIDMPQHAIPNTALHEIAHTRGFAREDEANFLAFLTGIYSEDPDITYSALYAATIHALNALSGADPDAYADASAQISQAVRRDMQAAHQYWKQFEGPVRETSTRVNDAYLQANLQEDGVRSYGRMVDLVLAWYVKQEAQGALSSAIAVLDETKRAKYNAAGYDPRCSQLYP